ncbi:hypothetical protein [Bradyrhizobium cenepequi]|uniref:hypothetical protein n=1 Tax=Bradyrhizobium cenepequi TaxID=2821403 RepID=UPI001CE33BC2|nr:hypothetical protein [Bradyrhizobium cenepequi]MCA6110465.1 hypothetical protein [Bradyrhizobium cenepequi]
MSEFTPKFPRTVSGAEWRAPLDHPEIEAIAKRLDHLYRNFSLSEAHRAEMIVRYSYLVRADEAIDRLVTSIAEFSGSMAADVRPLGDPGIRPKKPTCGGGSAGDGLNAAVGFALRLAAWVQRLEDIYGVTAWRKLGEIVNRDEGEVRDARGGAPQPGDDI